MPTVVDVPGHGEVEFPDSMSEADITAALRKLSPPKAAAPDVSRSLAFGRGAVQGATLGFGDEVEGAVQALGQKVLPESLGGSSSKKSFMDLYRESRDASRKESRDAQQAHGGYYLGGNLVGGLAPSVAAAGTWAAAPAYGAAEKLTKAGKLLGMGAGLGAAGGLGASEAPTLLGEAKDVAVGAGLGALSVPIGEIATRAGGFVLRKAGDVLRSKALENARRVIVGKQNSLSAKNPISNEAVQEALDVGAVRPFNTTQNVADKLAAELERVGGNYEQIVATLEQQGIKGPDAQALARQFATRGRDVAQDTLNEGVPAVFSRVARQLPGKSDGPLALSQAEALKRSLQRKANYEARAPGADMDVNAARKEAASMLRQANEDAIDQGVAAKLAEQVPPLRAAIKDPSGRTYVGRTHYDAVQQMPHVSTDAFAREGSGLVDGFVTPQGRFLTRDEASAWMRTNQPRAGIQPGPADSEELIRAAGTQFANTPEGQQLVQAAGQFVPVKQQYGRLAEAERWASQGANRIANSPGPNIIDAIASAPMHASHGPFAGYAAKQASKQIRTRLPATAAWLENNGADFVDWLLRQGASHRGKWTAIPALQFGAGETLANARQRALAEALRENNQ